MTTIHDKITSFLQAYRYVFPESAGDEAITKAGVVPYICDDGEFYYYVMCPRAQRPELGDPLFQFGKGTRMYHSEVGWRDMRHMASENPANKENLALTALREGIEELGLRLENIVGLQDMGNYDFTSASTGASKPLRIFAAEVASMDDFLHEREIAETTSRREWLTLEEFKTQGRPDYYPILERIEQKLKA